MSQPCLLAGVCSGCPWINKPYEEQRHDKVAAFEVALSNLMPGRKVVLNFVSAGEWEARDRVDLTLEEGRLGLYSAETRSIVDIPACPLMSARLEAWFHEFRSHLPAGIRRGSIRLRIGPGGLKGAWLDFANRDIKELLDQRHWLRELMARAVVEIGQRRKRLVQVGEDLKLKDPIPEIWFETYTPAPFPLYGFVGSFTQPGMKTNRLLVGEVMRMVSNVSSENWLELGAGIGNFTIPIAMRNGKVVALESDPLSIHALKLNVKDLKRNVRIVPADFRKRAKMLEFEGVSGILCDPPRSGLGEFVTHLQELANARHVIYVSCYPDTFFADAKRLEAQGFRLRELSIVDQFPQSPHVESVALFEK